MEASNFPVLQPSIFLAPIFVHGDKTMGKNVVVICCDQIGTEPGCISLNTAINMSAHGFVQVLQIF